MVTFMAFLLLIWGINSVYGSETLLTFNISEKVIKLPLPQMDLWIGTAILAVPLLGKFPALGKLFSKLYNFGVTKQKTEEDNNESEEEGSSGQD